jgi:acetyl esterase/lipase
MVVASKDVVSRVGARDLNLDIYSPDHDALDAAVILLHGGGWMFGDRQEMADYARELAASGFTAICAEYRLLREAAWPAQILDVRDVVAWTLRQAPALGVSREKIAVLGMSAGGQLAFLAAGTPTHDPFGGADYPDGGRVAAVVSAFAPPELHLPKPGDPPSPVAALLGPKATEASARAASPLSYITQGFPPTLLLSGTRDAMVPYQAQLALFGALEAAGVASDLRLYHGHTHEFTRLPSMLGPVMADVALFLKRAMVDPDHYTAENEALNPFAKPGFPPPPPPLETPADAAA